MKRKGRERIGEQVHAIQAIGYDLCLCKDNHEDGVILNGKGEEI